MFIPLAAILRICSRNSTSTEYLGTAMPTEPRILKNKSRAEKFMIHVPGTGMNFFELAEN